jgi:16S rRNA (uracil1498-N3)-methyltransferase
MVPRLFVPTLFPEARVLSLPVDEAEHLVRVLRVKPGAAVRVFDGRGFECEAQVSAVVRHEVTVEIGRPVTPAAECRVRVTLAQAVLKGDKIDDVIRDVVMMGVAAVRLMLTARTDVPPAAFTRGGRVERWRRIAIASAKQCGRAVVPEIYPPASLPACLDADRSDVRLLLVEPSAAALQLAASRLPQSVASAIVLIGPEGGWAAEEVSAAVTAGCGTITLGARTLRADATPLVALSVLQYFWGDIPRLGARDEGRGIRDW